MFRFKGLHELAAPRGDGLRQEILELLAAREALGAANVEDIGAHLAEHFLQAGANPVGKVGAVPPAGVLPFRKPEPSTQTEPAMPLRRRDV